MGFYGDTFLNLKKFFYRFFIKNTEQTAIMDWMDSEVLEKTQNYVDISPQNAYSEFTLEGGNRWIQLSPIENEYHTGEYQGIKFFHAPSTLGLSNSPEIVAAIKTYATPYTAFTVEKNTSGSEITQLKYGDQLAVSSMYYDGAGHAALHDKVYFALPQVDKELNTESDNPISNSVIAKRLTVNESFDGLDDPANPDRIYPIQSGAIMDKFTEFNNNLDIVKDVWLHPTEKDINSIQNNTQQGVFPRLEAVELAALGNEYGYTKPGLLLGADTAHGTLWVNGQDYKPLDGAEIFNDLALQKNDNGAFDVRAGNVALGKNSHAEGRNTIAIGRNSHAEGYGMLAYGQAAHAEGYGGIFIIDVVKNQTFVDNDNKIITYKDYVYEDEDNNSKSFSGELRKGYYIGYDGIKSEDNGYYNHKFRRIIDFTVPPDGSNTGTITLNDKFDTSDIGQMGDNPKFTLYQGGAGDQLKISLGETTQEHKDGGVGAHAEGYKTFSIGDGSHSEGRWTNSFGDASHSEGEKTQTYGQGSHAEGYQSIAWYDNSHAEGYSSKNPDDVILDFPKMESQEEENKDNKYLISNYWDSTFSNGAKFNLAGGFASHAEGQDNLTLGTASHAEGHTTLAYGNFTHTQGEQTFAYGIGSHAEGYNTYAIGKYSHAEGYGGPLHVITVADYKIYSDEEGVQFAEVQYVNDSEDDKISLYNAVYLDGEFYLIVGFEPDKNLIHILLHEEGIGNRQPNLGYGINLRLCTNYTGHYAHSEGEESAAVGKGSHAQGLKTVASGEYSHAAGENTIAYDYCQFVIGKYNNHMDTDTETLKTPFIIGWGDAQNRNNIFCVRTNGEIQGKNVTLHGADYAEYFEWQDQNVNEEDRIGYFVSLIDGEYIKIANSTDKILGIISGNASVVGDSQEMRWQSKYLTDIYGRYLYEDVEIVNQTGETVIERRRKINPNYDKTQVYIPRSQRKEWDIVGLLGKIIVNDDGSCIPGKYCACNDHGIATISDNGYYVMKRLDNSHIQILFK